MWLTEEVVWSDQYPDGLRASSAVEDSQRCFILLVVLDEPDLIVTKAVRAGRNFDIRGIFAEHPLANLTEVIRLWRAISQTASSLDANSMLQATIRTGRPVLFVQVEMLHPVELSLLHFVKR